MHEFEAPPDPVPIVPFMELKPTQKIKVRHSHSKVPTSVFPCLVHLLEDAFFSIYTIF